MLHFSVLFIVLNYLNITTIWGQQTSTTVRPYEFGFTIDEQQHRYEKRDERGIVMGEFGFITADGIYHVTVYATDEEGKFRILAMKSYPYESPPKTVEMIIKPRKTSSSAATTTKTTTKTTIVTTSRPILHKYNLGLDACGGCLLPDRNYDEETIAEDLTTKPKTDFRFLSKTVSQESLNTPYNGEGNGGVKGGVGPDSKLDTLQSDTGDKSSSSPSSKTVNNPPLMDIIIGKVLPAIMTDSAIPSSTSPPQGTQEAIYSNKGISSGPSLPDHTILKDLGLATAKSIIKNAHTTISSPSSSFSPSLQSSPPLSPSSFPSSQVSFSPNNVASLESDSDLYRFKYLLDYQGHTERGSHNGNKIGNYFAIGDDDIERTIEYIANENGYQPRIRWRKLDMSEINAKSKENSLKDYEFVWFRN